MTEKARAVLSDAEYAWNRLELSDDSTEHRVLWFATVALLRAVGHVLDKVDGPSDPAIATATKEAWRRWHADPLSYPIFHKFVDEERNILLKEYAHRYEENPGPVYAAGEVFILDDFLFAPLAAGRFAGQDGRDVAREAIDWWVVELDAIDARVAELSASTG